MKKMLALCLALTMALGTLAGCSGAAGSSSSAAAASGSAAADSASQSGETAGKALSGKVVYWSMYNEGEPEAMAIQKAADMFMEDYPDCEVEIQWTGRSNQDIVGPALEGGEQIDILDNFSYEVSPDRYLDITDMMESPALGQEDMTVAESLLPVLNQYNAQSQAKAGLDEDKYYGLQIAPWVVGFFYNKDLFEQAGITETPTTWDELLDACQKLKDAGINAITCDDAYMTMIPNKLSGPHGGRGHRRRFERQRVRPGVAVRRGEADLRGDGGAVAVHVPADGDQQVPGRPAGVCAGRGGHVPERQLDALGSGGHGRRRFPLGLLRVSRH